MSAFRPEPDLATRATTAFYGLVRPPALHSSPVTLGEALDALARGFSFSSVGFGRHPSHNPTQLARLVVGGAPTQL